MIQVKDSTDFDDYGIDEEESKEDDSVEVFDTIDGETRIKLGVPVPDVNRAIIFKSIKQKIIVYWTLNRRKKHENF